MHRGQLYTRFPASFTEQFIVGADLGQASDPTAIAILHHQVLPLSSWTERNNTVKQDTEELMQIRYLQSLPLGMPYPAQVEAVAELLQRSPLRESDTTLILDETGVGRAVADLAEHLKPIRPVRTVERAQTEHPKPLLYFLRCFFPC